MHCPTCRHNRETYEDIGPGETWVRCSVCHKILERKRKSGNGAAIQRRLASDVIHGANNMRQLSTDFKDHRIDW